MMGRIDRFLVLSMVASVVLASNAHAYEPAESLMLNKGFSPMTAELIQTQARRQEWKEEAPRQRTIGEQIERNIFINDWLGNVDPFGSSIIRERQ